MLALFFGVARFHVGWIELGGLKKASASPLDEPLACLQTPTESLKSWVERLARVDALPTRSGPEGSSRSILRLGRCPVSHLQ